VLLLIKEKLQEKETRMCEFCYKHGEGKKWYLQAENYSEDLMSDLRRRKFIKDFFESPEALHLPNKL